MNFPILGILFNKLELIAFVIVKIPFKTNLIISHFNIPLLNNIKNYNTTWK